MTKKPNIYIADRLYVPEECVDESILGFFSYEFRGRKTGSGEDDREPDLVIESYRHDEAKGFYAFPRGNLEKLRRFFGEWVWEDRRSVAPHKYSIKFTGSLYEDQKRAALQWIEAGTGILRADTGWGKNVVLVWLIVALRQRALVFGDNRDLVEQMHQEFREKTDIEKLEKKLGKQLAGTVHEQRIREFYPVVTFTTYQTFLDRWKRNKKLLKRHKNSFGLVWLNECHIVPAPGIAGVFSSLNPRFRGGDTATPERKDGKEVITFDIVGPVTAEGDQESLDCEAEIVKTGVKLHSSISSWNTILSRLTSNSKRNELICERVTKEADDGRSVLVLTDRVWHAKYLARELRAMGYEAAPFFGGNRDNKGNKAALKSGELQILVAVSKMTQKGFNIPILSSLHITCPMNNPPNLKQRVGRIRRVYLKCKKCLKAFSERLSKCPKCDSKLVRGKPGPRVTYYADENNTIVMKCAAGNKAALEKFGFKVRSTIEEAKPERGKTSSGLTKFGHDDE
jgi:superfamily II DNA or RNA helicase